MLIAAIVLGSCGLVFGVLGFIAGTWSVIKVLAASQSTHRVEYISPPNTTIESDLPPEIAAQVPVSPKAQTLEGYLRANGLGQSGYLAEDPDLIDLDE